MARYEWLFYVALAGLAWGTYVPIIFYGGKELGGQANARLMAVLCVGVAYFVIGVLLPLAAFATGWQSWPAVNSSGLPTGRSGGSSVTTASWARRPTATTTTSSGP